MLQPHAACICPQYSIVELGLEFIGHTEPQSACAPGYRVGHFLPESRVQQRLECQVQGYQII